MLFTFNRMLDPQQPFREAYPTSFPYFSDLGFDKNIERIEKLDDYTVRFDLKTPDVIFVRNLAMSFASILSAEYAVQLSAAHREADINQLPVGTGPFVFRSYEKDALIRYDANRKRRVPGFGVYTPGRPGRHQTQSVAQDHLGRRLQRRLCRV